MCITCDREAGILSKTLFRVKEQSTIASQFPRTAVVVTEQIDQTLPVEFPYRSTHHNSSQVEKTAR